MPSEVKVVVIKSPIAPVFIPDHGSTAYADRIVYYIKLSDGLVATRPEDFPNKSEKEKEDR